MPRLLNGLETVRKLTYIRLYRIASGTPGDTVTTAPIVKADATVAVTAITNFTAADPAFIIGTGGFELVGAIGTPNVTMPLTNQKAQFAQAAGARFVEAVMVDLGKIEQGGFTLNVQKGLDAIISAQDDTPVAYEDQVVDLGGSFGLLGFNPENLQLVTGTVENVSGAGTTADNYQASIGGPHDLVISNMAIRVGFLRNDNLIGHFDLLNARIESSGGVQIGKGGSKAFQCGVKFPQMIMRYSA